ncbi:MAG TPA: putative selenate ABC transporter substrate-binding protein [Acidimicrobiales bacterium]|nr:putative selenate ABC transporter substrate-binding protein [Acidimicrobiales bacterium]
MHDRDTRPLRGGARLAAALVALVAVAGAGCGGGQSQGAVRPLVISAIPDQDPERLRRLHGAVADHLERALGVPVRYEPVTDYTASVSLFAAGELDLVWFGGLTGVQARLQAEGARAVAQRDIDARFRSVFIASASSGLGPVDDVAGLSALAGRRFTFGSESSTSGRLMPQWFLDQAGVAPADFAGPPGFSGSHDRTIALVEAGTYEAGALNEQVWTARLEDGTVDPTRVEEIFRTPAYHDYHWVIGPGAARRYGAGFVEDVTRAFVSLDRADPQDRAVLDLFGAGAFVEVHDADYRRIEDVGRRLGLIT